MPMRHLKLHALLYSHSKCDTPKKLLLFYFLISCFENNFRNSYLCKSYLKTQKYSQEVWVTFCTTNYYFIINKRKRHLENLVTWGDTNMAQENTCKQAREIFTNQIQSKTKQLHKILNHRDLWIDWRFDWDGIRPGEKIYILVHWDSMRCHVVNGETLLRVQLLSVSPFHKSIIELVTYPERECRVEFLLVVLVCMVVIQLGGGVGIIVLWSSPMVGRN